MNQEEINVAYKKFKLPDEFMPKYSSPQDFAQGFKKCSILQESIIVNYSNTTKSIPNGYNK